LQAEFYNPDYSATPERVWNGLFDNTDLGECDSGIECNAGTTLPCDSGVCNTDGVLDKNEIENVLGVIGSRFSVSQLLNTYDEDHDNRINRAEMVVAANEAVFNQRMNPQQYVRDKDVWCAQFGSEPGDDPCDCNWWAHHLPDFTVLAVVWGTLSLMMSFWTIRGVCRKQRCYAEFGIAGVPNIAAGHMVSTSSIFSSKPPCFSGAGATNKCVKMPGAAEGPKGADGHAAFQGARAPFGATHPEGETPGGGVRAEV